MKMIKPKACAVFMFLILFMLFPWGLRGQATSTASMVLPTTVIHSNAVESISLQEAIRRSQESDTSFAAAKADNRVAKAEVGVAKSALLPGVVYHNQYLYTQAQHGSGKPVGPLSSSPIFIANNGVHEYVSQALVTETIGAATLMDVRKTKLEAIASAARLEVARRGLVVTVVENYYAVLLADEKVDVLRRALDEAMHFGKVSSQLEAGGEVAHADTIKAKLQVQQRQRDLSDAEVNAYRARLDLAVLLFADPLTPYTVAGDLHQVADLPTRAEISATANTNNPDLLAAMASFQASAAEVMSARFDYLPSLSVNYSYGIDAAQFTATSSDGTRNLGYAASATLDIPVWDWFATRNRIKQSSARRDLAKVDLSSTQRRLVASIEELYREAEVAHQQMASFDASVHDAVEALRLADLRYTNGEGSTLEVVDAQNTLVSIETSRADGVVRYNTALANLQTLTGNLP